MGRLTLSFVLCAAALAPLATAQLTVQRDVLRGTVVGPAGKPLVGAMVEVWRPAAEGFTCLDLVYNKERRLFAKMRTTKTGSFALQVPRGACHELHVTFKGHATVVRKPVYAGEEWNIKMQRPGILTGRVTLAGTGEPVAGALLRAWNRDVGDIFVGRTDEKGRYRFTDVEPGDFNVRMAPPRGSSPQWMELSVGPGETVKKDVELPKGVQLTGKVVDAETGKPIAGALVGEGWVFNKGVRTNKDGVYLMHGYGSWGYHEVHAVANGYCRVKKPRPNRTGALHMDFELRKGVTATGRVLGPDGKPMKGVYVAAICSSQPVEWLSDRTKADGSYRMEGLSPSLGHEMYFRKDGYATVVYDISGLKPRTQDGGLQVPAAHLQPPRVLAGTVVNADGNPQKGVMVYLLGANADRATGLVKDRKGAAAPAAAGAWKMTDSYVARRKLRTNRHGHFYFADLPPGTYSLKVGGSVGEVFPDIRVTKDKDPKPIRCQYDG